MKDLKKLLFAFATMSFMIGMNSCNNSSEVEYVPVQLSEDGSWCFIDAEGNRIGKQEWEFEPTLTVGGLFAARTDDGITVYKWKGDEAEAIDSLENLVSVGEYNEGLLPVTPSMQRIRVVNGNGKMKFELGPINGEEISSCDPAFHEGMLIVRTNDSKTGVVNSKGDVIVEPKYSDISQYYDGHALAVNYDYDNENSKGPQYYILDKKGEAKKISGKFGYPNTEEQCGMPHFDKLGNAYLYSPYDTVTYTSHVIKVNVEGEITPMKEYISVQQLNDGGIIATKKINNSEDNEYEYVWMDKEGKILKKVKNGYFYSSENYVVNWYDDTLTIYDLEGNVLKKFNDASSVFAPGGKFGFFTFKYDSGSLTAKLFNQKLEPVNNTEYCGIGQQTSLTLGENFEGECMGLMVESAYIDITAAAAKIVSMASGTIQGKKMYFLGQSVKDILEGENPRFFSGTGRTFTIPTRSTGQISNGVGFWINGTANANSDIVAPTYQSYFQVHHYDYWGNAWGHDVRKQVGVHFNASAQVDSFDIRLHTNFPTAKKLREAISRRMKKDGYTKVYSNGNYDEYNNGYNTVIIYGGEDSRGVGALIGRQNVANLSDAQKSALISQLN